MARRDFRQLGLADSIVRRRGKKSEWLERLDTALDWRALEAIVESIDASREGGLACPLLTYVVPGAPQPAAQAVAGGVQQGGGADPGRGRAAVRDHEADLRPSAGALPRAGAQRRPAAGD